MSRKFICMLFLLMITLIMNGCSEKITLKSTFEDVTLVEGETIQIDYSSNDTIVFTSSDISVATVDSSGMVTAVGEGSATVTMSSKKDSNITKSVTITVLKLITLTSTDTVVNLTVEDTYQVNYESNSEVTFTSLDTDLFVVDNTGLITAKKEGTATLVITSTDDETVEIEIEVNINKLVSLNIEKEAEILVVDEFKQIVYTSNDDVIFQSADTSIVTVDSLGVITAIAPGETTVKVACASNLSVFEEVLVTVYSKTEAIEITGESTINMGTTSALSITPTPATGLVDVSWESKDTSIATIDEFGVITPISSGKVSIIAVSNSDSSILDSIEVEVVNYLMVDHTKSSGETTTYLSVNFNYGETLFNSIGEALNNAADNAIIYIANGTYTESLVIDKVGITIQGLNDVSIQGSVSLSEDDITIKNINFIGMSHVKNTKEIKNFTFEENVATNLSLNSGAFIELSDITGVSIRNNTISNSTVDGIKITNFLGGLILIEKNTISDLGNAIIISAEDEYDITTQINIVRNKINNVTNGIEVNLLYGENQKTIEAYARFNEVTNYSSFAAKSNLNNTVNFTLNYWGTSTLDYNDFENIDPLRLRSYYESADDIISENDYNPLVPVEIVITNPISEILIGESYKIEYELLPLELESNKIKFITSDSTLLSVSKDGVLTPLLTGTATITVRSSIDFSINTKMTIIITTTPGIELTPSYIGSDVRIGDTFTLHTTIFPQSIKDSPVVYSSSDETIATIDASGNIEAVGKGTVTFTVALEEDASVTNTYTTNVYDTLDENNLLDLLTTYQVSYSTPHEWVAYGVSFNYVDKRYESVSRYYFGGIEKDTDNFVPVSNGIRPGELMPAHPDGVTAFNEDNIYWIVVHDTANTNPGSGARSLSNYLNNAANAGTELWTSWHYSIDDTEIYQHLPENERAYHAGDGSTLPTQGSYTGGGNRNGIGIEMAINQDGDLYRTWQRTAKLVADIMYRNDLPRTQLKYHIDFSGKDCPRTLRNAGLIWLFEEFTDAEFRVKQEHPDAVISLVSHNPEYLDNTGRIIKMPDRSMTVSYTITVTENGVTNSRTFYTYLPGIIQ